MQQNVKNVSYLTKTVINLQTLGNQSYEAVVLPSGSEIMSINVEVLEAAKTGTTLNIGLQDNEKFFSELLDLAQKANYNSSKITSTNKQEVLTLKLNQESNKGLIVLRVFYFLPSEIMAEF